MLNILVPQRQLYLKLKTLVNWSEHADVIRNCEESLAPKIVTDNEVKEALKKINTYIELRILTEEVLPPAMKKYRVADGRVTFCVDKEFEVVLTPNVAEENVYWVILDLKILVQSENDKLCSDVDLSLHENQIELIKNFAQSLLIPPPIQQPAENSLQGKEMTPNRTPRHLPLLKLYDYLHTLCLDIQLEVLFQQAFRLQKTRWTDNLLVEMDPTHTTLKVLKVIITISYNSHVKLMAQSAQMQHSRRSNAPSNVTKSPINHDVVEISIVEETPSKSLIHSTRSKLSKSSWLNAASRVKPGVINDAQGLNYPRKFLRARWSGLAGEIANTWTILDWEFDPANLNFEHILLHVTQKHAESNIKRLKEKLCFKENLEKDVKIVDGHREFPEGFLSDDSPIYDKVAKKYLTVSRLCVWFTKNRYIKAGVDVRSGRIFIEESNRSIEEYIKNCEEKLNMAPNPLNTAVEAFSMIKYMAMMDQIEKAARYLRFDIHHGVILRKEDVSSLGAKQPTFLRFPQQTDYFLICGIGEREIKYWLTVLSREPPVKRHLFDKTVRDPTHRITFIQRIPLEDLIVSEHEKLDSIVDMIDKGKSVVYENENSEMKGGEIVSGRRNFEEINGKMEDLESSRKKKHVDSAADALISYHKMEELLKSHNLSFTTIQPDISMEFIDSNTPISLNSAIPVLKLDRKQLLSKLPIEIDKALHVFGDVYIRYVASEISSRYGLDIMVQDDDQTLVSDASLSSNITKLQPLSLWDKLSKSVVVEGNNDANSIPVERFISLTEGIVIPINDCQSILRWLDTHVRQLA
ncbi:3634_t:CDS:10 [Acaulospora colombiana]|uniref:3634_t:CDS:1 n=1 Tax=Acaulospora colombiana TaxID=27376 RepID=A0ACA9KV86_9GLOM|nr:3634_t:CDS:10 [Acaulospora colombiana]